MRRSFKGGAAHQSFDAGVKFDLAAARGAAGILVVTDPRKSRDVFDVPGHSRGWAATGCGRRAAVARRIISGLITRDDAARGAWWRWRARISIDCRQRPHEAGSHAVVKRASARIAVRSTMRQFVSHNVVARVEGSDPRLKDRIPRLLAPTGIISARTRRSRAIRSSTAPSTTPSARPSSSRSRERSRHCRHKPQRSILFVAVTAEEKGLPRIAVLRAAPARPIPEDRSPTSTGWRKRLGRDVRISSRPAYGLSTLDEALGEAARFQGRTFVTEAARRRRRCISSSDQIEFAKAGIPAAFPFSGSELRRQAEGVRRCASWTPTRRTTTTRSRTR